MPTQYDIKWVEDAISKANSEFTLAMCNQLMSVIDWKETTELEMIRPHFQRQINMKVKRLNVSPLVTRGD